MTNLVLSIEFINMMNIYLVGSSSILWQLECFLSICSCILTYFSYKDYRIESYSSYSVVFFYFFRIFSQSQTYLWISCNFLWSRNKCQNCFLANLTSLTSVIWNLFKNERTSLTVVWDSFSISILKSWIEIDFWMCFQN